MVVDERIRQNIYRHFAETLGPEEAAALIQNLVTVHDVATKDDLRVLGAELRAEMHAQFVTQTRWIIGFLIGYTTAMTGIALAVAKLFL
jgi:hypothetical protein